MKKLMLVLVAGCMSAAVAGAYAAQGSPADSDKAGRMGPGTAAGQMGASDPTPGKAGPSSMGGTSGARSGASSSTSGMSGGSSAGMGGSTAGSSSMGSSSSATSSTGGDEPKGRRSRRAARAAKG